MPKRRSLSPTRILVKNITDDLDEHIGPVHAAAETKKNCALCMGRACGVAMRAKRADGWGRCCLPTHGVRVSCVLVSCVVWVSTLKSSISTWVLTKASPLALACETKALAIACFSGAVVSVQYTKTLVSKKTLTLWPAPPAFYSDRLQCDRWRESHRHTVPHARFSWRWLLEGAGVLESPAWRSQWRA